MRVYEFRFGVESYTAHLQKIQLKYGWMEARMMKLQQEYDTAFQIMAPRQQQQGEQ